MADRSSVDGMNIGGFVQEQLLLELMDSLLLDIRWEPTGENWNQAQGAADQIHADITINNNLEVCTCYTLCDDSNTLCMGNGTLLFKVVIVISYHQFCATGYVDVNKLNKRNIK